MIGYGNPSRGDDGLGPALAERLDARRPAGVTVEIDYQLAIEHAALVAEHDAVVFVDAATDAAAPFYFARVPDAAQVPGLSHAVSPGQVMELARSCFGATPPGYLLGIRARHLEGFRDAISAEGAAALDAACAFVEGLLEHDPREWPERETADGRPDAHHSLHR